MPNFYFRYMNRREKLYVTNRPTHWEPKRGAACPGHNFDPKNKKPGGYRRFDRWYDRPVKAKKLYWRHNHG